MTHRTFFSNLYLFDKFLGKPPLQLYENENSARQQKSLEKYFLYTSKDPDFSEFANWIESVLTTKIFLDKANEFIEINQKLLNQPVGKIRNKLVDRLWKIQYG